MTELIFIVLGILSFALVTAILYGIGLKKKMGEEEDLAKKLRNTASLKIIKYLKVHGTVTLEEIEPIIKGVKAKNFYSKKTAVIVNSKEFKGQLLEFMLENAYLVEEKNAKGKKIYALPSKMRK